MFAVRTMSVAEYAAEVGRYYRTILNWYHAGTLPDGVTGEKLPTGTILIHVREARCPHCGESLVTT
jgi:hypothetical protein